MKWFPKRKSYQNPKDSDNKNSVKIEAPEKSENQKVSVMGEKKITYLASRYLIRPIVSEKAAQIGKHHQYVFEVSKDANKFVIKKSLKELYGVLPMSVQISNVKGKAVRFGKRQGKRKDWKKAMVSLKKGESINLYEGV